MPPPPLILNRLVSARYLLDHSGPRLTKHSDSRAVAHAVLMAHDAAELALGAMAEYTQAPISDKTSFPELLEAVNPKIQPTGLTGLGDFKRLNKIRVAFKHHGLLPDTGTWFNVIDLISHYLDQACKAVFGIALTEVEAAHLIQDPEIVQLITEARSDNANEKFREALEKLANALLKANLTLFNQPLSVLPGDPDPQQALLLTGYGVDPSSFIIMQQLLPTVSASGIAWKRHETGHPGNWTEENVSFCADTLIEVLLRLQSVHPLPQPTRFYHRYRDVLTITVEHPEIRKAQQFFHPEVAKLSMSSVPLEGNELTIGDKIYGRFSVCQDGDGCFSDPNADIENAEWIKIDAPVCEKYRFHPDHFLTVRRKHVAISFEELKEENPLAEE
ncbi:MAG TPA: hypothetical protein VI636_21555 [Candidatus Angelobacter sp.]